MSLSDEWIYSIKRAFCISEVKMSAVILSRAEEENGKGDNNETGNPCEIHCGKTRTNL